MFIKNRLSLAVMVNVIVILEIDPVKIDEFLAVILENAAASRLEPGCLRFEVSRDNEQSNLFALSESYVTAPASCSSAGRSKARSTKRPLQDLPR
ncbi:MAG: putative quinol monooxygenase [Verrucomicrobia bacterium]|nr:putative quinol monooxygenase [Verrucomicrobiota bacterium]